MLIDVSPHRSSSAAHTTVLPPSLPVHSHPYTHGASGQVNHVSTPVAHSHADHHESMFSPYNTEPLMIPHVPSTGVAIFTSTALHEAPSLINAPVSVETLLTIPVSHIRYTAHVASPATYTASSLPIHADHRTPRERPSCGTVVTFPVIISISYICAVSTHSTLSFTSS